MLHRLRRSLRHPLLSSVLTRVSLLLLAHSATASSLFAADPGGVTWQADFDSARATASNSGKPLWVQFTGSWCLYCRKMDRETFSRPEVAALARDHFVAVKVRSDEREDLVAAHRVTALPMTILLAPDGRELARREGYASTEEFLALMAPHRPELAKRDAKEIALAGYDPVLLVRGKGLTSGQSSHTASFDGQEFRFVNASDREAFLKEPERYLPSSRGRCPVRLVEEGHSVPGDARFGVYYRGRLYLCADEAARDRFAREPRRYADVDLAEQGHCPHCGGVTGRKVRGLPQFAAVYRGRRYHFPDDQHRQAFRSEPDKYLR